MAKDAGSATIETIIWLPILLVLLGAVVQFGLYFNAKTAVQAASFEAARQAAVADNPLQTAKNVAYDFADNTLPGWSEDGRLDLSVIAPASPDPGEDIEVLVTYQVPGFFTGLLPGLAGDTAVTGSSKMSIEERP